MLPVSGPKIVICQTSKYNYIEKEAERMFTTTRHFANNFFVFATRRCQKRLNIAEIQEGNVGQLLCFKLGKESKNFFLGEGGGVLSNYDYKFSPINIVNRFVTAGKLLALKT